MGSRFYVEVLYSDKALETAARNLCVWPEENILSCSRKVTVDVVSLF